MALAAEAYYVPTGFKTKIDILPEPVGDMMPSVRNCKLLYSKEKSIVKLTVEIDDKDIDAFAALLGGKIQVEVKGPDAPAPPEDDLLGDAPAEKKEPEVTLAQVQDAIREKASNDKLKPKVVAALKKFGAARGTDLKAEDYPKFMAEMAKVK